MLFKLFYSIAAWEVLSAKFGIPTWKDFNEQAYLQALDDAWKKGKGVKIWNNAYMQNDLSNYAHVAPTKHPRYIRLLKEMMNDNVTGKLQAARTYRDAFLVLYNYSLHEGFIGMQLTDINYSPVLNFDEDDFIVPGRGALDGMQKCFGMRPNPMQAADWIKELVNDQEGFFEHFGLQPVTLFGRRLHAIDCQNVFCETDKVARVKHPQFNLDRTKIKQTLKPLGPLPAQFFPPKWKIA